MAPRGLAGRQTLVGEEEGVGGAFRACIDFLWPKTPRICLSPQVLLDILGLSGTPFFLKVKGYRTRASLIYPFLLSTLPDPFNNQPTPNRSLSKDYLKELI